jgi:serine/threonine protein kinase
MDIRPGDSLDGPNGQSVSVGAVLGRGGFGQVFEGRLPDATRVAVKTLLTSGLNDAELRVLQNEACCGLEVVHPNVVRFLHVEDGTNTTGRPPYIVMEYVDGGSLRHVLDARKNPVTQVTVEELRAMFLQIAEGMEAVSAKLVHRDLKPENVLVDAAARRLKIADFGLAKMAGAATRSATFKNWGTPQYQSPEAFDDGPNTGAMDIYSAGVMYFELATLTLPIHPPGGDNSWSAWRRAHLLTPPHSIRAARPDLPIDLVQVIMQMIDKNPELRPDSWSGIISRLQAKTTTSASPDVSELVKKAAASVIESRAAATRGAEVREKRAERVALLEQAFAQLVNTVRGLTDAFNDQSHIVKLNLRVVDTLSAEVRAIPTGFYRLDVAGNPIEDFGIGPAGTVRMLGRVMLTPQPQPSNERAYFDRASFGGFNLFYVVRRPDEAFGTWNQIRFERSPLASERSYPHWFALPVGDLPRKLQLLGAIDVIQHEQRTLDDTWFMSLLTQMV